MQESTTGNWVSLMNRTFCKGGRFLRAVMRLTGTLALVSACLLVNAAGQKPIISVQPGENMRPIAGNGAAAFSGDNGAALNAGLASPFSIAADSQGNIYVADTNNHRVRVIDVSGSITTFAGNGEQGFSGDGGAATTAASLNSPTAVAVDASGSVYIADSHNNRVRVVSQGVITTFAGNGAPGFSGDGGAATSAELNRPRGVAVDPSSNAVYIADTLNHRVRMVNGAGIITTVAGNGTQGFFGDNGLAAASILDTPTALAFDASGNLLIADSNNHRIRQIANGTITTSAGNGTPGMSGDGGPAVNASLDLPMGVALDASGNLFIADSNNNTVRRVDKQGVISTVVADGEQGYFGTTGPPGASALDTPTGVLNLAGNIYVADRNNNGIRRADTATLVFASQVVGTQSAVQTITIGNVGNAVLNLASVTPSSSDFSLANSGSCGTLFPHAVNPGKAVRSM